ncbi:MAG: hypothetical protein ACE5DP_04440 [Fidelibacterota bacterium]
MHLNFNGIKTKSLWFLPVFFLLTSCTGKDGLLPQQLGDLNLTKVIQGEKAIKIIETMHRKTLGTTEYTIGYYGGENSGNILYLSLFENADAARKDLMDMSLKMAAGTPVFAPLTFEETKDGIRIRTEGMGFVHYFYRSNRALIWWQVEPDRAESTYRDLLNFDFEKL